MATYPVTFFCPDPSELARAEGPPVDETVDHWTVPQPVRVRAWVVQTALRLREAGHDVAIQATLPDTGIVVLLPEPHFCASFHEQYTSAHRDLLIVTIRADIVGFRSPLADAEIVQNGCFADDVRTFHIPHWPQPGLRPRDPSRGARVRTLAFKGDKGNLHPNLFTDRLDAFLDMHDITARLEETVDRTAPQPWHDYHDVDVLLAVRRPWHRGDLFHDKPASKLINAWHAGVPALLGPEYAFRELRDDPLDYVEVTSDADVIAALTRFIDEPDHYTAMVEHGRQRAQAFTVEQITERWAEVLFERIPRLAERPSVRASRRLALPLRQVWNWAAMPPTPLELRKQLGHVYRHTKRTVFSS